MNSGVVPDRTPERARWFPHNDHQPPRVLCCTPAPPPRHTHTSHTRTHTHTHTHSHTHTHNTHHQVVDLLAPYQRGGKIGLFGGAGVGKTVLIMELINNVAKAHGAQLLVCRVCVCVCVRVCVCRVHVREWGRRGQWGRWLRASLCCSRGVVGAGAGGWRRRLAAIRRCRAAVASTVNASV
jgi:hypothetical protein